MTSSITMRTNNASPAISLEDIAGLIREKNRPMPMSIFRSSMDETLHYSGAWTEQI